MPAPAKTNLTTAELTAKVLLTLMQHPETYNASTLATTLGETHPRVARAVNAIEAQTTVARIGPNRLLRVYMPGEVITL